MTRWRWPSARWGTRSLPSAPDSPTTEGSRMADRVWVVDDEPLIRTAMLAVLAEMGHDARGFGNAEELYTALVEEGKIPDLLVLDQRLPDEYGSTILHSLR